MRKRKNPFYEMSLDLENTIWLLWTTCWPKRLCYIFLHMMVLLIFWNIPEGALLYIVKWSPFRKHFFTADTKDIWVYTWSYDRNIYVHMVHMYKTYPYIESNRVKSCSCRSCPIFLGMYLLFCRGSRNPRCLAPHSMASNSFRIAGFRTANWRDWPKIA